MQIFLPYEDIIDSAKALDTKRLMKQRVESFQILNTLQGKSSGWQSHPAVRMVRGYEAWLCMYSIAVCLEARRRGYEDNLLPVFELELKRYKSYTPPLWLGSYIHKTHQSNLIRKDSSYYKPQFPNVPNDLPYFWPV